SSIERKGGGELEVSPKGGELFMYTHNDESYALGKEYFKTWVSHTKKHKLNEPTKIPTLLRVKKGVMSISPEHVASFIPITSRTKMFEGVKIVVRCGSYRQQDKIVPGTMIMLSGDDEIIIEMPDHVVFYMFLHPK
ncbi:hypothetical protein BKA63DRAFT_378537, partial [Paraphoma chrysanthemicola]